MLPHSAQSKMKKIFLLAALCVLSACASPPATQENPSQDKVLKRIKAPHEMLPGFGQLLMLMAYVREYGIPDDEDSLDDLNKMAYVLNEFNENKELINLLSDGLWFAEEDKKDESLAVFDEIYKRYSKDKRATARDTAVLLRLFKHQGMLSEGKVDEAQAVMDELSREFDVNDPGIQTLLKLMK
jgi:TolA-binding protein